MRVEQPFNPLDKRNLGTSVADALLQQPRVPVSLTERFVAAGIYAIYYDGAFKPYRRLVEHNRSHVGREVPIYVGKAIPRGARKGGFGLNAAPGTALYDRLAEHAESIESAQNLKVLDFSCRYLAVDDIWIPLGENLLIETFSPLWNKVVEGFGNHDPGSGRHQGKIPHWDVLHPGRAWARKLQPGKPLASILADIEAHFRLLIES